VIGRWVASWVVLNSGGGASAFSFIGASPLQMPNESAQFLAMQPSDPVIFSYCLDFGNREFFITVTRDGIIHWDDYMQRRKHRPEEDKRLELQALMGSDRARKRLESETHNYTIEVKLPEEVSSKIEVAAEMLEADKWTIEHEKNLDEVLKPLFWEHVNPYLEPPLKRT
jgi:hypothetical protein